MNDKLKQYRNTMRVIGGVMLMWALFFMIFMVIVIGSELFDPSYPTNTLGEIIGSFVYDAAYLGAFMLPVAFFKLMLNGRRPEPMRFEVKLKRDTLAWIFGGVACIFAFSLLNNVIMNMIGVPTVSFLEEAMGYTSDSGLVLQFISIALVPAFCEEFLFRGLILSNLMPYGKGAAIIISSVLFGLMHGNFYQFLYTTVAGVILGLVYVVTDSIWCSVLMHMINNSVSVIQTAVVERLTESASETVFMAVEGVIFLAGLVSIVYLIIKYGKKARVPERRAVSRFGDAWETCAETEFFGISSGITHKELAKGFFSPTVILFIVYSMYSAVAVLFA